MRKQIAALFSALALAVPLFVSSPAHAGLEACGDINVSAEAKCEADVTGGCEANCDSLSFEAACSAKGYVQCDGQCSGTATAECTGSCNVDGCKAKCDADPGNFDCSLSL